MKMYGFGESVLWKPPSKGPQHYAQGNMAPRLLPGEFLGYHKSSNSYRVVDEKGDVWKRPSKRLPCQDRWNGDKLKAITVTRWSLRVAAAPVRVDVGPPVVKHDEPKPDTPPIPRRPKITMKTLADYGFTEGCPQCEHIRQFSETRPGLNHWEKCRQRIIDAMVATPEGNARIEKYEDRVNRAIAARGPPESTTTTAAESATRETTEPTASAKSTAADVEGAMGVPPEGGSSTPKRQYEQGSMPGISSDMPPEIASRSPEDDDDDAMDQEEAQDDNMEKKCRR